MAISFARVHIHTRSKGHSAVAGAAYRSGSLLSDFRTGEIHDYTHRHDVVHAEILLPKGASNKFLDRETLWNTAESSERRKDAQLAKEVILALPKELNLDQQKKLVQEFAEAQFLVHGLGVDYSIHDHSEGNPHAHLLVTIRKIEGASFSLKKPRELNPVFYGRDQKKVYDFWHHTWRDFQNGFFERNGIPLSVDEHYGLSMRHQGRVRHAGQEHYLKAENDLRKSAIFEEIKRSPERVLDYLSARYATFTEKDLASFVFKNTENATDFQSVLLKVKANDRLLLLGPGSDGVDRYTTRESYALEEQMISQVLSMSGRLDKSLSLPDKTGLMQDYGLQEEQIDAVKFLLESPDIACLVGRAGTGKTFTMKAVHDLYDQKGFRVYGAALSGIAAKELEAKTGIPSDTIHSLSYRISRKEFQPNPGSILVIDEAGMVALQDMARIIDFAKTAHCKVVLLGDPDQLQPIMAGAPFRAILNHVGFSEMKHIQRQESDLDREASSHFAAGRIHQAVDHYVSQNKFHLIESDQVQLTLLNTWETSLSEGLSHQIILAYTRKQVAELNSSSRELLLKKGLLCGPQTSIQTAYGSLNFAIGDRIVFLKNNRDLGVCNGDFGTIQSIEGSKIHVQLKDRSFDFDSSQYKDFNYGYAVTVHKSQGATFDRAFVYLDGWGWDRFLSYVAFTRHRKELNVFANKTHYQNLDGLKKQLAQAKVRDNAIDYPLSFSERRGFDPESMLGRALDFMAGVGNSLKEGWLYVRNVEAFVKAQEQKNRVRNDSAIRRQAKRQFVSLKEAQSPEISLESWIRDAGWENLRKGEGRLFKENIEVLLNLREKFLDPKTSENQRKLVSKAFVSMVEKTFNNEKNLEIVKEIIPEAIHRFPLNFKASFERDRKN